MKVGAMPWPGLVSGIVAALLLASAFAAFADPLDDALLAGTRAYTSEETDPTRNHPGYVATMLDILDRHADKSAPVTPLSVKQYLIATASKDQNPALPERIGTWGNALHAYASTAPAVQITGGELLTRLRTIYDEMYPRPKTPPKPGTPTEYLQTVQSYGHEWRQNWMAMQ